MAYKSSIILNKEKYDSYFDNTFKNSIVHHLKCLLLGIFTLGLAYPWIICMKYEATCKHTVICGKRLKFIGNPKELIGHWIFWWIWMELELTKSWLPFLLRKMRKNVNFRMEKV